MDEPVEDVQPPRQQEDIDPDRHHEGAQDDEEEPSLDAHPGVQPLQEVEAPAAVPAREDQVRVNQHLQVLHHREPTQRRKRFRQLARGAGTVPEQVQDASPQRVRQGPPDRIEYVNHFM